MPPETQVKNDPTLVIVLIVSALIIAGALVYVYVFHDNFPGYMFSFNRPGPCAVLPAKYCDQGQPVTYPDNQTYLGFNVPSSTIIYAPFAGKFSASGVAVSNPSLNVYGFVANRPEPNATGTTFFFTGEFKPLIKSGSEVGVGQPIAESDGYIIDQVSNSSLLINFQDVNAEGLGSIDQNILNSYFKTQK
jgi:hypothetical protein